MYYAQELAVMRLRWERQKNMAQSQLGWTQDAQVIIITRIKLFEVEKKYIYSISYHRHLIFFFRYAAKLPVHPLSECVCVYVLAEKLLVKCS